MRRSVGPGNPKVKTILAPTLESPPVWHAQDVAIIGAGDLQIWEVREDDTERVLSVEAADRGGIWEL